MWVPPEDIDPIVLHAPTRKSVAVFGAVCVRDGHMITQRSEKFCAQSFLCFLEQLITHCRKGHKIVLVLDNARWHHSKALKPWLTENRFYLRLDFLPPYSPELNHIERVWKLMRRLRTHNRYFPQLEDLVEAVFDQFKTWQSPNETLRKLCAIL